MKKTAIRIFVLLLCAIMVLGLIMPAFAAETEDMAVDAEQDPSFKKIRTVEDLLAMAQDPTGKYVLVNDLDLAGVEWKPFDFSGVFDGNNHALLNLTLSQPGDTREIAYDGNRKEYECTYIGFFGSLRDAQVRNLQLLGVRALVETDEPCFMGALAGYCNGSTVTNCTVVATLELRAHNQIFGLGGLLGYGIGAVDQCNLDVVLICTDTDKETKDEQFLGGVYSTGYIDVTNTIIKIQAFASEYGYAHNGGITGLYMQHPLGTGKRGYMTDNTVRGFIKFFECNNDRRAYCAPFAGEILAVSYNMSRNLQYFKRQELREYDKEIRPCMCETPRVNIYNEASRCDKGRYPHTVSECLSCAFMDKYDFKMMEHEVTNWELVEAPTLKVEGLSQGICNACAATVQRVEPVLEPEPEPTVVTQPTLPAPTQEPEVLEKQEQARSMLNILFLVLGIASVLLVALAAYVAWDYRQSQKKTEE